MSEKLEFCDMLEFFHVLSGLNTKVTVGDIVSDIYNGMIVGIQSLDVRKLSAIVAQFLESAAPDGEANLYDSLMPFGYACHIVYSLFIDREDDSDYLIVFYLAFLHTVERHIGYTLDNVGNPFSPWDNDTDESL